jgi:hypothetical protein
LKNREIYTRDATWLYKQGDIGSPTRKVGLTDSPTSQARCATPGDQTLQQDLTSLVDMQGLLAMGAVDAYTGNPDSFFSHEMNFYYADFAQGSRMYFPLDLDSTLGGSLSSTSIYSSNKGQTAAQ